MCTIKQNINADKVFLLTLITIGVMSGLYGIYAQVNDGQNPKAPCIQKITNNKLGPIQSDIVHIRG